MQPLAIVLGLLYAHCAPYTSYLQFIRGICGVLRWCYISCIANLPRDQQLPLWAMGGERAGAAPIDDAIPLPIVSRMVRAWAPGNNGASTVNRYTPAHSWAMATLWLLFSTERYFSAPRNPPTPPEGPAINKQITAPPY